MLTNPCFDSLMLTLGRVRAPVMRLIISYRFAVCAYISLSPDDLSCLVTFGWEPISSRIILPSFARVCHLRTANAWIFSIKFPLGCNQTGWNVAELSTIFNCLFVNWQPHVNRAPRRSSTHSNRCIYYTLLRRWGLQRDPDSVWGTKTHLFAYSPAVNWHYIIRIRNSN